MEVSGARELKIWGVVVGTARNEDARFLSWVGSFTKGKPPP